MKIFDGVQGSDEWLAFRLEHFGASEAAAMLGLSKKVKRTELLRAKHTGIAKEFSDWVQTNILDNGHMVEAMARPIAEEIIGEELFPATYYDGKLSASTDGLTMTGAIAFEHKQWNAELAASVKAGILPEDQIPQCQQVMMVTGADRLLFMVSDGTKDNCEYLWTEPVVKWRKRITQGWTQFAVDLAEYQHVEAAPDPVAAPILNLPSINVQVSGQIAVIDNFTAFEAALRDFVDNKLIRKPESDQDFANLDTQIKTLKKAEESLKSEEARIFSQVESIDIAKRSIDMLYKLSRDNRLMAERLLEAEKANRRRAIQEFGEKALREHIDALNKRIGRPYMPDQKWADFVGVMKGKKTIASLQDAVDTELARGKIATNEVADRIQVNLNSLRDLADGYQTLFKDTATIVLKQNDDLVALVKTRIAEHKKEEADRVERERVKKEADDARAAAAVEVPSAAVVVAASGPALHSAVAPQYDIPRPASSGGSLVTPPAAKMARPSDNHIINTLSIQYSTHERVVIGWLLDMDLAAASQRLTAEMLAGSRK